MKILSPSLILIFIFTLFSCGKEEVSNAEVRLRLKYDDNPLVMFQNVDYPDGKTMYFTRVSFFIEDLRLSGDEEINLIERDYMSLTEDHLSPEDSKVGALAYSGKLSEGMYNVNFTIGVSKESNAMVPADFLSSNVLSNAAEYWPGWSSYVFAKIEGFIDLDGDGQTETGFALHLGSDEALRTVSISRPLTLDVDNYQLFIDIDLEKLFTGSGTLYDIGSNPQIHSPEQNPIVQVLADNLVTCFQ